MLFRERKIGYINHSRHGDISDYTMQDIDFDTVFVEDGSAGNSKRPELELMLHSFLKEDDHVFVNELSGLGRSMTDLRKIIDTILSLGAKISFISEGLTFESNNKGNQHRSLFEILTFFARFESSLVKKRQQEGIEKAKAAGKHLGRPRKIHRKQREEILANHNEGVSPTNIAKMYNISRGSVYKIVSDAQQDKKDQPEKNSSKVFENEYEQRGMRGTLKTVSAINKSIARRLSKQMSETNQKKYSLLFEDLFVAIIDKKYEDYGLIKAQVEKYTGYTKYKSGYLMNKIIAKFEEAGLVRINGGKPEKIVWK